MADPSPAPAGTTASPFVVRRSRWFVVANLAVAAAVLVLVALNAGYQWRTGGSLPVAALIAALVAVFFWQSLRQALDRAPVLIADDAGLALPTAAAQPIPWARVGESRIAGWPLPSQVDLDLPADIVAAMTLGQRFLGDPVIKRRGLAPGITIVARGLDRNAAAIRAAINGFAAADSARRM